MTLSVTASAVTALPEGEPRALPRRRERKGRECDTLSSLSLSHATHDSSLVRGSRSTVQKSEKAFSSEGAVRRRRSLKRLPPQREALGGQKSERGPVDDKRRPGFGASHENLVCDQVYKPGSVLTAIYLDASLPVRSSHLLGNGRASLVPSAVLLRIEFTAPDCLQPAGELLPRLSTLTSSAQAHNPSLCRRRQSSPLSLRLLSPRSRLRGGPSVKIPDVRLSPDFSSFPVTGFCRGMKRYLSVALFRKSPWAGVTRYPCPVEPGLSSRRAFRRSPRGCPTWSRL